MNTVGKTLVIVNLLFALVTGAFLVIDFMTRTNWEQRYKEQVREVEVAKAITQEQADSFAKAMAALRDSQKKINELENKNKDDEGRAKLALKELENRLEDAKVTGVKDTAAGVGLTEEVNRLRQEVTNLTASLKKREATIIALETEKNKAIDQAVTALGLKNQAEERNISLLDRLRELEIAYARLELKGGGAATPAPVVKNTTAANPPPAYVKGIVKRVADGGLVELSIGSDEGVNKDHTLEAYRRQPKAEYLGTIRILSADHHTSVGQLMRSGAYLQQPTLRPGDEVASSLRPPY